MKKTLILWLCCVIILLTTKTAERQRTQSPDEITVIDFTAKAYQPYQQEYERMLYPTVRISTASGTGSGVIFTIPLGQAPNTKDELFILTAAHVVGDESTVTIDLFYPKNIVRQFEQSELLPTILGCNSVPSNSPSIEIEATVIITDTTKDLALLRALCAAAVKATLAPKDYKPYLFTPVWAVGCSLGLPPRPSFGHLCALCPKGGTANYSFRMDHGLCGENGNWEISAPILPGNSGGPVYDARTYEVIGIAIWVRTHNGQLITTMAGIVPIQEIYEFLDNDHKVHEEHKAPAG